MRIFSILSLKKAVNRLDDFFAVGEVFVQVFKGVYGVALGVLIPNRVQFGGKFVAYKGRALYIADQKPHQFDAL